MRLNRSKTIAITALTAIIAIVFLNQVLFEPFAAIVGGLLVGHAVYTLLRLGIGDRLTWLFILSQVTLFITWMRLADDRTNYLDYCNPPKMSNGSAYFPEDHIEVLNPCHPMTAAQTATYNRAWTISLLALAACLVIGVLVFRKLRQVRSSLQ
jgi:hypothetical protein